jgi:RNA polymerase sigma factor (sigma-70 family)
MPSGDVNRPSSVPRVAIEDELLAVRCQLGERAAFDALIDRWHDALWRYARRFVDSDDACGDVVQDIWLRVLRGIGRLRDPARLRSWLFGIARRVVMDRLRTKYTTPPFVETELSEVASDDDTSNREETIGLLHEELTWLPVVERDVLVLFYLHELSLSELADVIGVPIGTVKSRLFRARALIRRRLAERGVHS